MPKSHELLNNIPKYFYSFDYVLHFTFQFKSASFIFLVIYPQSMIPPAKPQFAMIECKDGSTELRIKLKTIAIFCGLTSPSVLSGDGFSFFSNSNQQNPILALEPILEAFFVVLILKQTVLPRRAPPFLIFLLSCFPVVWLFCFRLGLGSFGFLGAWLLALLLQYTSPILYSFLLLIQSPFKKNKNLELKFP